MHADYVVRVTTERFSGFKFEDYGDAAGEQRSSMSADKAEKTCFDILRAKGIAIRPGEQNLTIRLESVRKPLICCVRVQFELSLWARRPLGGRLSHCPRSSSPPESSACWNPIYCMRPICPGVLTGCAAPLRSPGNCAGPLCRPSNWAGRGRVGQMALRHGYSQPKCPWSCRGSTVRQCCR